MKKWLLLICTFICLALFGCSKDDSNADNQQDGSRYYVKYEVYMPLGYYMQETELLISYISESGENQIVTSNDEWEGTFGPLEKGTKLYLRAEAKSGGIRNNIEYYIRLSVSKDKEPFVVKGEDRGIEVSSLYTEYKIDF